MEIGFDMGVMSDETLAAFENQVMIICQALGAILLEDRNNKRHPS